MPTKVAEIFAEVRFNMDGTSLSNVRTQTQAVATELIKTDRAVGASQAGFGKWHFAIQQAGYGIQDFMQQLGPMGLRGALSASANNWSQMAAQIHPVWGAVAGVAITLGTVLIPALVSSASAAENTKSKIDELARSFASMQQARDAFSGRRGAQDVGEISDTKSAAKEIDTNVKKRDEARNRAADIQRDIEALEQRKSGRDSVFSYGAGDAEVQRAKFRLMLQQQTTLSPSQQRDLQIKMDRGQNVFNDIPLTGGGSGRLSFNQYAGTMTVRRPTSEEDKAKLEAERESLITERKKQLEEEYQAEVRIAEAKKKGVELTKQELEDIKRVVEMTDRYTTKRSGGKDEGRLNFNDPDNARKAAEIEMKSVQEQRALIKQFKSGAMTEDQLKERQQQSVDEARRKISNLQESEADKEFEEADRRNREYTQKRETREKNVAKLSRELDRDNLGKRARDVFDIRNRLEERRDDILKNERDPEKQRELLDKAASAAERQIAALKPIGGDKTGVAGFAELLQKSLFGGDMTKDVAETARNTKGQLTKADELITAVRALNLGLQ